MLMIPNIEYLFIIFNFIFSYICLYKIFIKSGEKGYKAFIPIYSSYTRYKLFYSKKMFVINLILTVLMLYLFLQFSQVVLSIILNEKVFDTEILLEKIKGLENGNKIIALTDIITILFFVVFIINAISKFYLARSFGKSSLFSLCFIFIPIVCHAILAYSNCEYNGNKYLIDRKKIVDYINKNRNNDNE